MTSKKSNKSANIVFASFGLLLCCGALAESHPVTYRYGQKTDVMRVLSISNTESPICKPVDHIMKYINSSGKIKFLKYRALSDACSRKR